MGVKIFRIFRLNLSILLIITLIAGSYIFGNEETKKKKWIIIQIPRLNFGYNWVKIKNIPDTIRTVQEYNRKNNIHQLPQDTGGLLVFYSIGVGIILWDRIEVLYDLTFRDSYSGGKTTWDQIGFPSDDYLGYRFHGKDSNISAAFRFIGRDSFIAYAKFGINFNNYLLSSGSDAWNEFNQQHSVDLNYQSYVAGLGFKYSEMFLEMGIEFVYEFKSSVYDNISVQGFFIKIGINILPINRADLWLPDRQKTRGVKNKTLY